MTDRNPDLLTDFFSGCTTVPANRTLEVEIATASRVGLDGATIESATVSDAGELVVAMTDGRILHAGNVVRQIGLKGIAHFDTIPSGSIEPQLYIASAPGTYGHFRNRYGQPVRIEHENTIAFFYRPAGGTAWDYSDMALDMSAYRKKSDLTFLSSKAPAFSNYPPSAEAVEGLYDEATGRFNLAEGQTTVTSQTEVFGRIVYTDCPYIMIGFNPSYALYLETATGKCLCMDVSSKTIHYHDEPFVAAGITKKFIRVNTYDADSMIIDVEQSDNGLEYLPYTRINRGAWDGLFITYRTIGFYLPEGSAHEPKILSIGQSGRLMLDEVPVLTDTNPGTFEVLVPSDNFAGVARQRIVPTGKSFAGKRILLYGDSISADYNIEAGTYAGSIRKKFGTDDVITYGQIGQMLGSLTGDKSDSLANDQQIGFVTAQEPDLLIFQGGTSDYWHAVRLGEADGDIEDTEYVKTTTGGLRYLLHHLTKNLPRQCRILFVTPPPGIYGGVSDRTQNAAGHKMSEYVKRFRGICAEYHIPVCDFWAMAGWSTFNESIEPLYTIDGIHLSPEGYDRMTDLLLSEASRYC